MSGWGGDRRRSSSHTALVSILLILAPAAKTTTTPGADSDLSGPLARNGTWRLPSTSHLSTCFSTSLPASAARQHMRSRRLRASDLCSGVRHSLMAPFFTR